MRWWSRSDDAAMKSVADAAGGTVPNPDHAWRALGLVNEWIRHADAKAAVTLAFIGAMATVTFNLVNNFQARSVLSDVVVIAIVASLTTSFVLCARTLVPRVQDKTESSNEAVNLLFYASIAANFTGKRNEYEQALSLLSGNDAEVTRHIADQVHANAKIASFKFTQAKWAIRAGVLSGALVAVLAAVIGVANS